jgi:hypothetical protein
MLISAISLFGVGRSFADGGHSVDIPRQYVVEQPTILSADLSDSVGPRLLKLLSIQVERNLERMAEDRREGGIEDDETIVTDCPYFGHFLGGNVYALAVLLRFGGSELTVGRHSRDELERTAVAIVCALAGEHILGGGEKEWSTFRSPRYIHLLGMGAWLLWDRLDGQTRLLVARIMAHEADRFLAAPAPAQLFDDTQAESNAWTGGGIAVAGCMLKHHPHRERWLEKANEYMISAYATAGDVARETEVDGKPLNQWLTGPNAFPDYTVENHGIVHPDYIAAISEMVRSAVAFGLAGESLPEAVTFNAEQVFDRLMFLSLPDGTHFYPQGTDYTPRRVDSLFQACNIVSLLPNPQRKACFLRSLARLETMAEAWPTVPMSGWVGFSRDLGCMWGLTQNYLMFRLFGTGGAALPDAELDASLAETHECTMGQFIVQRRAESLASFSWRPGSIMGLAMPLDRDVLCYPLPGGYVGDVREQGSDASEMDVHSHHIVTSAAGFAARMELSWCSRKVHQSCAFVALPNGIAVYLEERRALTDVTISAANSGTIAFFDDVRWPYQAQPREYTGAEGVLNAASAATSKGDWINIDGRMGFAALGTSGMSLTRREGKPCIWRGEDTMYHTCRLQFVPAMDCELPATFSAGQRVSVFALVSCPNQDAAATEALAAELAQAGWVCDMEGILAFVVGDQLMYFNVTEAMRRVAAAGERIELQPQSAGWMPLR